MQRDVILRPPSTCMDMGQDMRHFVWLGSFSAGVSLAFRCSNVGMGPRPKATSAPSVHFDQFH